MVAGGGKEETSAEREQLCRDLTETTLDMLARYTYSNVSSLPSRSEGVHCLRQSTFLCLCAVQVVGGRVPGVGRSQQDLGVE